jgi:RNA-binding protein YhbY
MKKAKSSYDLALAKSSSSDLKFKNPMKYQSSADLYAPPTNPLQSKMTSPSKSNNNNSKNDGGGKHKVVIYFSDAYNNICNKTNGADDGDSDRRLSAANNSDAHSRAPQRSSSSSKDFMAQLKTVLEEKSKFTNKFSDIRGVGGGCEAAANKFKPAVPEKPSSYSTNNMLQINQSSSNSHQQQQLKQQQQKQHEINGKSSKLLPSFIESIDENNVIKLKIEQNFRKASELVSLISSLPKKQASKKLKSSGSNIVVGHDTSSIHELNFSHEGEMECIEEICSGSDDDDDEDMSEPDEGYFYDWSFVQEWRSR